MQLREKPAWLLGAASAAVLVIIAVSHQPSAQVDTALPKVTLQDGNQIEVLGLGVFRVPPGADTYSSVSNALAVGYRHLDTAEGYANEESVGDAVADSGIARSSLWITTKLSSVWNDRDVTYAKSRATLNISLARLKTSYLDLYLIHSPADIQHRLEQWRALCDAQVEGLIRSVGVSDYEVAQLEEIRLASLPMPAVLQLEVNPWLATYRKPELDYAKAHGIAIEAWGALGVGRHFDTPQLVEVASHYPGRSVADVLIRWGLQMGFIVLVTSQKPEHMRSNLHVAQASEAWTLTAADMALLGELASSPMFSAGADISGDGGLRG